jgi:hypothetical protein
MSDEKKSELEESLETLEKALEASEHSVTTPVLQVEDLSEMAHRYLTAGARYDLSQKATQLIQIGEDGRVFKAVYFATRVRSGNQEKAVQALARVVNDLSQRGLIHSCLAPMSSLELARMPNSSPQSVVFCFVLVPESYEAYCSVRYKKFFIEEGSVGGALEDLSPVLEDGEFLAEVRVSHVMSMMRQFDPKSLLQREIDLYLAILPSGTVVREVVECAITDLSVPYEVRFFNPLLKRVKKVDLSYVRSAEVVNDKLEQFNVFLGIRYFDKDRREIYNS